MAKLVRDKRTGDYYTEDKRFMVEKGTVGWNVYELVDMGGWTTYQYSFGVDTLKEARESI